MTHEEKVLRYRKQYMAANKSTFFKGTIHYVFNGSMLFGSAFFLFLMVENLQWIELLTIPFVCVLGSLTVYLIHRYPLHQKYKLVRKGTYDQHTLKHHRFYTNKVYHVEQDEDSDTVLFPPIAILLFCAIVLPSFYLIVSLMFSQNVAFLFTGMSSAYFIFYEIVHYISHLPETHWIMKIGYFKRMRKHHLIHHDPRLMEQYNFNIVIPLFDYVFGTKIRSTEE